MLALAASAMAIQAQSLTENSYYLRSLELKAMAEESFDAGEYDAAAAYAVQSSEYSRLSDRYVATMVAKAEADRAIAAAKDRLAWAETVKAPENFPGEYAVATSEMEKSLGAYTAEEFPASRDHARAVLVALGDVREIPVVVVEPPIPVVVVEEPKAPPLPATYKVRLIPERRDCLWRIAEYPFIYDNPLQWPVLYEANKSTFRDPNNPHLIFPGQVLKIPSIEGEEREGEWDPMIEYVPLPKP